MQNINENTGGSLLRLHGRHVTRSGPPCTHRPNRGPLAKLLKNDAHCIHICRYWVKHYRESLPTPSTPWNRNEATSDICRDQCAHQTVGMGKGKMHFQHGIASKTASPRFSGGRVSNLTKDWLGLSWEPARMFSMKLHPNSIKTKLRQMPKHNGQGHIIKHTSSINTHFFKFDAMPLQLPQLSGF